MSEISAEPMSPMADVNPAWFVPKHKGARYYSVLADVHKHLRPRSYLEVGIRQGHSLALAHCDAIGIDPRFELLTQFGLEDPEREFRVHLFKMTSDKFFAEHNAREILGVDTVDFQFLDGMHQSDFLLRDIINAEQLAAPNSIIALHDCMPIDIAMTLSRQQRERMHFPVVYPNFWAGDVWRVIPILKKYRPELQIYCMDAHPTGLVLITGFNSKSTVLKGMYDKIIEEMGSLDLASIGLSDFFSSLPALPTSEFLGAQNLQKHFNTFS